MNIKVIFCLQLYTPTSIYFALDQIILSGTPFKEVKQPVGLHFVTERKKGRKEGRKELRKEKGREKERERKNKISVFSSHFP